MTVDIPCAFAAVEPGGPSRRCVDHSRHARLHRLVGRRLPQWLVRRFGQTLFLYGTRGEKAR